MRQSAVYQKNSLAIGHKPVKIKCMKKTDYANMYPKKAEVATKDCR